jgi:DMSO/TMAO reductase YedYZ molybdopterin-dependent catalytic subunit
MKDLRMIAGVVFCLAAAAAFGQTVSSSITLIDVDGTKTVFSIEDLRKMPQELEEQCICVGQSSGFIGTFDFGGVRLEQILDKAKATATANDNKRENTYVVFKGTDGYQVIATWTELTMTSEGKRVLLALDKNAEPLPEPEGKIRLILPGDKYVGRSVRNLETIELRVADGYVEKKKEKK